MAFHQSAATHKGYTVSDMFAGHTPGSEAGTKINDGSSVRLLRKSHPQPCKKKPFPEEALAHDSRASISPLATRNRGPRRPLSARFGEASPAFARPMR